MDNLPVFGFIRGRVTGRFRASGRLSDALGAFTGPVGLFFFGLGAQVDAAQANRKLSRMTTEIG
jgi:hypothetical protein